MRSAVRLLLACLPLVALGCGQSDHLILLHLRSQTPVETLDVDVSSIEGIGPLRRITDEPVRDPNDIRIAIRLEGPALVRVHVTGETASGERLVATRCYNLDGTIEDEAILAGPVGPIDADGDSFASDASQVCLEPDGPENTRACNDGDVHICSRNQAEDCDDNARDIFPGAPVICQNGIDEDCDGEDELCADDDGDGSNACPPGVTEACDCDDGNAEINPSRDEPADGVDAAGQPICNNGVDENCDGFDTCCDADGDGSSVCSTCNNRMGVPADRIDQPCLNDASCSPLDPMTGQPTMIVAGSCTADSGDCDDSDPNVFPSAPEICDGADNNCNGLLDELDECRGPDLDGDGSPLCGHPMADPGVTCEDAQYECDPGRSPNNREQCGDGIDNDVNGMVDDGCPAGDVDNDGQVAPQDCAEGGAMPPPELPALAYDRNGLPGFTLPDIDQCGDSFPNNCQAGGDRPCSEDTDGDGFVEIVPASCEGNFDANPRAIEACDGVDNDCDLVTDEVLGDFTLIGCAEAMPIDFFADDFFNCGSCRNVCQSEDADVCVMGVCDCAAEPGTTGCLAVLTAELMGTPPARPVCDPALGCVDLATDEAHCGAINRPCGAGEQCIDSQCRCGADTGPMAGVGADPEACQTGALECCNNSCVNVTEDEQNCNRCNYRCGANTQCLNRVCRCDPTRPQFDDCDGDEMASGGNGCETNLGVPNNNHCGTCGNRCTPDATCGSGLTCVCNAQQLDCAAGEPWCETPFTTMNCGACGARCGNAENCRPSGQCECGSTTGTAGMGRACGGGEACCSNNCRNLSQVANCRRCGNVCGMNETCGSSDCLCDGGARCGGGQTCCPGTNPDCVNTDNDRNHCGSCGNTCTAAMGTCSGGNCRCNGGAECGGGVTDTCCGSDGCVNLNEDENNCGGCGVICGADEVCSGGQCTCPGTGGGRSGGPFCSNMGAGFVCCPGGNGCINTSSDAGHCGACTVTCGGAETCSGGQCRCSGQLGGGGVGSGPICTAPTNTCCPGNGCINLANNAMHCGACTVGCGGSEGCSGGQCRCSGEPGGGGVGSGPHCGGSDVCCSGSGCNDLTNTFAHCGACDTACGPMETCSSSRCECGTSTGIVGNGQVCNAPNPTCCPADSCTDTTMGDISNCGGCNMPCMATTNATATCTSSSCNYACTGNNFDCDASPWTCETAEDANNCGGCGIQCVSGASCESGICRCGGAGGDVCTDGVEGDRCMGMTCRCGGGGAACMSPQTCTSMTCG